MARNRLEFKMFEKLSSRFAKMSSRARLVPVAAALSAIAIAAPASTAAAATPARAAGPGDAPDATVTGPRYISTAPTTFINNNNQVSAGDVSFGGQSA
jgi:curli biogenesis system outer membrane secretion channel CsgG